MLEVGCALISIFRTPSSILGSEFHQGNNAQMNQTNNVPKVWIIKSGLKLFAFMLDLNCNFRANVSGLELLVDVEYNIIRKAKCKYLEGILADANAMV